MGCKRGIRDHKDSFKVLIITLMIMALQFTFQIEDIGINNTN